MLLSYIGRRIVYGTILILLISIISFIVIQLPPGDFATSYMAQLQSSHMEERVKQQMLDAMVTRYGLDQPIYTQYLTWMKNIITKGDFGQSFQHNMPVSKLIRERLPATILISLIPILFQFLVAVPVAIISAVKKNSVFDYIATFLAFIGQAIPNFLLALVLMILFYNWFGFRIGGLFSREFQDAAWSFARLIDMFKQIAVPIIVIGTASTAAMVRSIRATMLDELGKEYMRVARSKGMPEWKIILKYPTRIAFNPVIAGIGGLLPALLSGALMVEIVVNLPTTGPVLLDALMTQDMYVAGSFLLLTSTLSVIGVIISDICLAFSDPRISYLEVSD